MSFRGWQRVPLMSLFSIALLTAIFAPTMRGQQESTREDGSRKVQSRVAPAYPDLARRMKIAGTVKVQLTVAPNGAVKDTKVMGGHPLLANAVIEAVRKWRFEAHSQTTTETLEFRFETNQ